MLGTKVYNTPTKMDNFGYLHTHCWTYRDIVRQALEDGKPVPQEVLKDYPEL